MGIKAIKAIQPKEDRGILEVDLSEWAGEGTSVRFRQPKAADLFPDSSELMKLHTSYPEVSPNMAFNCMVIARCYVVDVDDSGEEAFLKVLMDLSRQNDTAFFAIYWAFVGKYMDMNIKAKVSEAKNESAV